MEAQYSPMPNQPIVVPQNQMLPSNSQQLADVQNMFKSVPVIVTCPHCGFNGLTQTQTNFNIANCICCWLTDPICWCCFQLCRGKDLSCNDANHFCSRCNKPIGTYTAC